MARIGPLAQTVGGKELRFEANEPRLETAESEDKPPAVPSHERLVIPAQPSLRQGLDRAIWAFLLAFAAAQPLSIAAAQLALGGALLGSLLWLLLTRGGFKTGFNTFKPSGLSELFLGFETASRQAQPFSSPLARPLLAYLLFSALSSLFSAQPAASWDRMPSVLLVVIAVLAGMAIRSPERAKRLVTVLLASALLTVAYTGWQFFTGIGLQITHLDDSSPLLRAGIHPGDVLVTINGRRPRTPEEFQQGMDRAAEHPPVNLTVFHIEPGTIVGRPRPVRVSPDGVPRPAPRIDWGVELEPARHFRAQGFYNHFTTYAEVLVQLAALSFGLFLTVPWRPIQARVGLGIVFGGLVASLLATLTRASWLALAAACFVLLWVRLRRPWLRAGLLGVLVLAAIGTNAAMREWRGVGLLDRTDPGTDYRLLMWRDGLRLIQQHPLLGIGMETIKWNWEEYDLAAYKKYGLRSHFHSTPMQLAVERGLLTLAAWIWLMVAYYRMLLTRVRQTRSAPDWFSAGLPLGILGATTGFLVSSSVHYNFGDSEVVMLFWLLMGLAVALRGSSPAAGATAAGAMKGDPPTPATAGYGGQARDPNQ